MKHDVEIREVIDSWPQLLQLASFARKRHGYCDSNGGFGITYPNDLDEYQREIDQQVIPEHMVEVFGFWGQPNSYSILVSEAQYLRVLASLLKEQGLEIEANDIDEQALACQDKWNG
jgi:hypothetical protein